MVHYSPQKKQMQLNLSHQQHHYNHSIREPHTREPHAREPHTVNPNLN